MPKHSSHVWSETGRCIACDCRVFDFESDYRCIPAKALSPFDGPPLDDEGADWWGAIPEG